jgi:hypothetical protein
VLGLLPNEQLTIGTTQGDLRVFANLIGRRQLGHATTQKNAITRPILESFIGLRNTTRQGILKLLKP